MNYEYPTWYGITFVACEPVREDSVRGIIGRLFVEGDWDSGIQNVVNKISMLTLNLVVESWGVAINFRVHEKVVIQSFGVAPEFDWMDSVDLTGKGFR